MIEKVWDALFAIALGVVLAVAVSDLVLWLTGGRGTDPARLLDAAVNREKWAVWLAAEQATRHPVIDGQLVEEADYAAG